MDWFYHEEHDGTRSLADEVLPRRGTNDHEGHADEVLPRRGTNDHEGHTDEVLP